ncbi:MAG TPA: DUF2203 family protein [Thermoanaerobaculia bacterium]|nr:DUF2203 family protein [Thermoanaerobaculia bacterium]
MSSNHGPGRRIFSYDEALATFPLVRDLTAAAVRQVEAVAGTLQSREELASRGEEISEILDGIVREWMRQVSELGCEVKGRWLVDWDSGDGYYCWCFPETSLGFFHTYEDGFAGRVPIN